MLENKTSCTKVVKKATSALSNACFCVFLWFALCRDRVYVMSGPQSHAVIYSHSSHPLITESHKGNAQPLHRDAVLLSIELVGALLF